MRLIHTILILFSSTITILANTIIHTEDFNNCSSFTWSSIRGSSDTESFDEWSCSTFNGRTYMEIYDNDGNNDEDWLVSPAFNLDNYTQEYFSFEYNNNTSLDGLTLMYSNDYNGNGTAAALASATWNTISLDLYDIDNDSYVSNFLFQRSIDLSAITGSSVYLAFRYISPGNSTTQGWSIDNVRLTADYYENITNGINSGDKCYDLKQELHDLIKGQNTIEYTSSDFDVWDSHYVTDRRLNDAGTKYIVYDMYSDNPSGTDPYEFTLGEDRDGGSPAGSEGVFYNREHIYPKSWWGGGTTSLDTQYTDIHYVVPSDKIVNSEKLNFPLGDNDAMGMDAFTSMNGSKVGDCTHPSYSGSVFEPIDEYKGDFARMYLYFSTRYNNNIDDWESNYSDAMDGISYTAYDPWLLQSMICWHENDPVSQKEIDRNNAVYSIQQNRNPFIDHPEYVFFIWGTCATVGCPTVLPVELTSFNGHVISPLQSQLKWITESEINSSHFIIEHSKNGSDFTRIGEVFAQGESLHKFQYTFIHKEANVGKNYYRLQMVDLDGSFEFSEIILVKHEDQYWVHAYPNYTRDQVKLEWKETNDHMTIFLLNTQGKLLKSWSIPQENQLIISLSEFPVGTYLIQCNSGQNLMTKKVIKF